MNNITLNCDGNFLPPHDKEINKIKIYIRIKCFNDQKIRAHKAIIIYRDSLNQKALLEAALFVSDQALSLERLSKIVGIGSEEEVKKLLAQIKEELEKESRGVELAETPEGYELRVKQEYRERVAKLAPLADLSDGMLRTLAIIAAKQPVKQSLIVKYQGNKTYGYVVRLEDKGLIKSEKFARTKLMTTTPEFEKYFGTSSEQIKSMLESKGKIPEEKEGPKEEK